MIIAKYRAAVLVCTLFITIPTNAMGERVQQMIIGAATASTTAFLLMSAFSAVATPLLQPTQIPLMIKAVRRIPLIAAAFGSTSPFWAPEWEDKKPKSNSFINGFLTGGALGSCMMIVVWHNTILSEDAIIWHT